MHFRILPLTTLAVLLSALTSLASSPPIPPLTNGDGNPVNNGMKHINVSLSGTTLGVSIDTPPASPVTMTAAGFGKDFTPSKFDVLEEVFFNAQHGWLPDGFFTGLPAGSTIWMKRTGATQPTGSTFKVYDGGNMAEGMAAWSMNEIYTADGDIWQWDGLMQHDYYTADLIGDYSMSFEIYVGDMSGDVISGFTPAVTTLNFTVIPEPSTFGLAILGLTGLMVRRRR